MTLFLIMLVVWIGLCLLLGALAIFLQSYLNETPPDPRDVAIRAPIGGTALALFLGFWCILASSNPDRWAPLTEFSTSQELKPFPKMEVTAGKQVETYFLRRDEKGREIYKNARQQPMPAQPDELSVMEDGEEVKFKPDRDSTGKLKPDKDRVLRYRDGKGRVMEEGYLGKITIRRTGWLISYFLLNLVHAGVWLAAAWPIMRFSLGQSLVVVAVAWGTTTLFVMPPILHQAKVIHDRREKEAKQNARLEMKNRRESVAALPPVSGVRLDSPREAAASPGRASGSLGLDHYLLATAEGNSTLTLTSWPAVTATRSSLTAPLYSAFRV